MPTCPHCKGEAQTHVLACTRGKECVFRVVPCFFCQGTGTMSEQDLAREAKGNELRELRRSLNLSGREAAKALAMDAVAFNALEWGKEGTTLAQIEAAMDRLSALSQGVV